LRAHPKNDPLAALPESHPARQALICHAECRRDCVGREIAWIGPEADAFDQSWESVLLGREFRFSSFAYCFVSIDLVLEEWLSHPAFVTDDERHGLAALPLQNVLLDECEKAARQEQNTRVLLCVEKVRRRNRLLLESIHDRISGDGLSLPPACEAGDPCEILGLSYPTRKPDDAGKAPGQP
jgi:hypothetical protein